MFRDDKTPSLWKRIKRYSKLVFRNAFPIDGEHNAEFIRDKLIEKRKNILKKDSSSVLSLSLSADSEVITIREHFDAFQDQVNNPFHNNWLARLLGVRNLFTTEKDITRNVGVVKLDLNYKQVVRVKYRYVLLNALKVFIGWTEATAEEWQNLESASGKTIFILKLIPLILWNTIKGLGALVVKVLTLFTEVLTGVLYGVFKSLTEVCVEKLQELWERDPKTPGEWLGKWVPLALLVFPTIVFGVLAGAAKILQFVGNAITSPMQNIRRYWNMDPSVMPDFLNEKAFGDEFKYPIARHIIGKALAVLSGLTTLVTYALGGFFAAKGIIALSTTSSLGLTPLHPVAKAGVDIAANSIIAAGELTPAASAVGSGISTAWTAISTFVSSTFGIALPTLGAAAPVAGVGVIAGASAAIVGSTMSIAEEKIADKWHAKALKNAFDEFVLHSPPPRPKTPEQKSPSPREQGFNTGEVRVVISIPQGVTADIVGRRPSSLQLEKDSVRVEIERLEKEERDKKRDEDRQRRELERKERESAVSSLPPVVTREEQERTRREEIDRKEREERAEKARVEDDERRAREQKPPISIARNIHLPGTQPLSRSGSSSSSSASSRESTPRVTTDKPSRSSTPRHRASGDD